MKNATQITERGCSRCGKIFIPAAYHAYKDRYGLYCSWTCYNHREEGRDTGRRAFKRVLQYDTDGRLIREHGSATDAAEHTGLVFKNIQRACRTHEPYKGYIWNYEGGTK